MIKILFVCHGRTLGLPAILGIMGHSDIGVTLNTYTHLGAEDAKEELGKYEKMA